MIKHINTVLCWCNTSRSHDKRQLERTETLVEIFPYQLRLKQRRLKTARHWRSGELIYDLVFWVLTWEEKKGEGLLRHTPKDKNRKQEWSSTRRIENGGSEQIGGAASCLAGIKLEQSKTLPRDFWRIG